MEALERLSEILDMPEDFAVPSEEKRAVMATLLKDIYEASWKLCGRHFGPLEELYIDGIDSESVWEELQLANKPLLSRAKKQIRRLGAANTTEPKEAEAQELNTVRANPELQTGVQDQGEQDEQDQGEQDEQDQGEQDEQDEQDDHDEQKVLEDDERDQQENGAPEDGELGDNDEEDEEDTEKELFDETAIDDDEEDDEEQTNKDNEEQPSIQEVDDLAAAVNDDFFDLDEMENFIDEEENRFMAKRQTLDEKAEQDGHMGERERDEDDEEEEDDVMFTSEDLFEASAQENEDDDEADILYPDFFDDTKPKQRTQSRKRTARDEKTDRRDKARTQKDDAMEDDTIEDDPMYEGTLREENDRMQDEQLSAYEKRQLKLNAKISELEKEAVAEKPWELRGEIGGKLRPEDSLLSTVIVDMERASKPAPAVTVEKNTSLEDMIRKRIKENNFDDVVQRVLREKALTPAAQIDDLPEVSQEKSKQGLGQIYEKEFMRTAVGVQEVTELSKDKAEILRLFQKLCMKLDALSHFHFAPKPVVAEVTINTNTPAIQMEDILPVAMSNADTAAPEDVYERKRGREEMLKTNEELTQEDRKRIRRERKAEKRKETRRTEAEERIVARINPGLGNKYEKQKMLEEIRGDKRVVQGEQVPGRKTSALTKSSQFFKNMQQSIQSEVASTEERTAKKSSGRQGAAFYKL